MNNLVNLTIAIWAATPELLEDGYWVNKLGIRYRGQLRAMIQPDLQVKSIKFMDELLAENDDVDGEDELVKFDADFALMTRSLGDFIHEMIRLFMVNTKG